MSIQKISIDYSNIIEENLEHFLTNWKLFSLRFPKRKLSKQDFRELCLKYARTYYNKHKNKKAKVYKLSFFNTNFSITYKGTNNKQISKSTAYIRNVLVNDYVSILKYRNSTISSIRFGTPVISKNKDYQFKKVIDLFSDPRLKKPYDRVIYISLLTSTKWKIDFIKATQVATIKEPEIVSYEQTKFGPKQDIASLFIQMSDIPIIPTGHDKKHNNDSLSLIKSWFKDEKIRHGVRQINFNSKKLMFENIVEISRIHWLLNKHGKLHYGLAFHCKSAKDRTGVFDAINKATYLELYSNNGKINIERVKYYSRFFLLFSLIIATRSVANYGLKLKSLRHIVDKFLTPQEIIWFIGIAYYI